MLPKTRRDRELVLGFPPPGFFTQTTLLGWKVKEKRR